MIRMSRLADYGVVVMTHIAAGSAPLHTTHAVAGATRIPEPTVSKVLKALSRRGLLDSYRGIHGGYALARAPADISVSEIIAALDGPIALTECLDAGVGPCRIENICPTRTNWRTINDAIRRALDGISLADMTEPVLPYMAPAGRETRPHQGAQ